MHNYNRTSKPHPTAGPVYIYKLSDVTYTAPAGYAIISGGCRARRRPILTIDPPTDFHSRERPRSVYDAPSTSPWLPAAQHYTRYKRVQLSGAGPSPTTGRVVYTYARVYDVQGARVGVVIFLMTFRRTTDRPDYTTAKTVRDTVILLKCYVVV